MILKVQIIMVPSNSIKPREV